MSWRPLIRAMGCRARKLVPLFGCLAMVLAPLVAAAPLRVAVISDLNGSYGSTHYESAVEEAVSWLVEQQPDLVISTGDMVAGQRLHPPLLESQINAMWSAFHHTVSEPLAAAGIPLAVTPGNHDASGYARFVAERNLYAGEWRERVPAVDFISSEHYPFDYAFAMGDTLFISLDVTRVGALPLLQLAWLESLLEQHGLRFRHRVVFSHLPVFPFTQGRETQVSADHELEQLLRKHRVDIYLSGHHHAFYPGYHEGVRHISQACLGAAPRRLLGTNTTSSRAITWLEFEPRGVAINAFESPHFDRAIDWETLPRSISSHYGTLIRDDLRPRGRAAAVVDRTGATL